MYELREIKKSTYMLLLYELLMEKNPTLSLLGEKLGMSTQGIANYINELEKLGYLEKKEITKEGIEFLHRQAEKLHIEISGIISNLQVIRSTEAIADMKLKKGERAYLYMKRGLLYAGRKPTGASGIVKHDADAGEVVHIEGLEGIVEIIRGKITILVYDENMKMNLPSGDVYGGFGLGAVHYLEKTDKNLDIKFSVPESCVEACTLGLNVVCVVNKELLQVFLKRIADAMQKYGVVEFEIVSKKN
ncbi:MAG: hypothetical protein ACPL1Y_00960 [Thermoplasmata archaeon]